MTYLDFLRAGCPLAGGFVFSTILPRKTFLPAGLRCFGLYVQHPNATSASSSARIDLRHSFASGPARASFSEVGSSPQWM